MRFVCPFLALFTLLLVSAASSGLAATLESPAHGATLSGVGFISGWKCDAQDITVRLDDGTPLSVAMDQPRADTRSACGGATNNGFIIQMNWALLGDGQHTVAAYDDGRKFASATFTVATFGTEFLRGAGGDFYYTLNDFPKRGMETSLVWEESTQHFEVFNPDAEPDPEPPQMIHGECGSARNTCQAGTPNDNAFSDTSTHYRWRCDGQNGGRNSGMCQVAKPRTPDPPAQTGLSALLGVWEFALRFSGSQPLTRPYPFERVVTGSDGTQGIAGRDPLDNSVFVAARLADLGISAEDFTSIGYEAYTYALLDTDDLGQGTYACFVYLMNQTGTNQLQGLAFLLPASRPTIDACDFSQGAEGTFTARRTQRLSTTLSEQGYRPLTDALTDLPETDQLPDAFRELGEALSDLAPH